MLTFNADGAPEGASAFTVKSNRPWTLEVLEGSDWVTPSATQGSGDGTVEFTIPASNVGRIAKLSFNLKNAYGAYWTKEVTIEQGEAPKAGEVSALVAYIKNTWPSLESGTEELNYSQKTIPAVILANNEGGNNFGKLYVGDNITLPNSRPSSFTARPSLPAITARNIRSARRLRSTCRPPSMRPTAICAS